MRNVILPMLTGEHLAQTVSVDDIDYATDLGLVRRSRQGLEIANPIYKEIVPRQIGFISQLGLESHLQTQKFVQVDGRLDFGEVAWANWKMGNIVIGFVFAMANTPFMLKHMQNQEQR